MFEVAEEEDGIDFGIANIQHSRHCPFSGFLDLISQSVISYHYGLVFGLRYQCSVKYFLQEES